MNIKVLLFLIISVFYTNAKIIDHSLSLSNLHTTSHEYVYHPLNTNYKLSELIWDSKNTKLLGYQLNYSLENDLSISGSYKTKIKDGSTIMDDYDWLDDNNPDTWSHWSNHPDTTMTEFSIFDISMNILTKNKTYNIDKYIIFGYKQEHKKFKAYNGTYIYSSSGTLRDEKGSFNGLGITYIENYRGLYFGLKGIKEYKKYNFYGILKYSPLMEASNSDTHHLRSFTNTSTHNGVKMTDLNLGLKYKYTKNISLGISYNYTKYAKSISDTKRTYEDGRVYVYGGNGIENQLNIVTLKIEHNF
jgi:outer membrane protease